MSLSELRQDYIFVLRELSTEIRAVQEIYNEVVGNCYEGVGVGGEITEEEFFECLEDYRNGV